MFCYDLFHAGQSRRILRQYLDRQRFGVRHKSYLTAGKLRRSGRILHSCVMYLRALAVLMIAVVITNPCPCCTALPSERQADIIFRDGCLRCSRGCDIIKFGDLHLAPEVAAFREVVHQ